MEHVPCDLCGNEAKTPLMSVGSWRLVRCSHCSLVFLDPRPDPERLAREYDWFSHAPLQTGARRREESRLRRVMRRIRGKGLLRRTPREAVVLQRVREFVQDGRFLDVGCGDGFMVEAMGRAGFSAYGIDISEAAVAAAHQLGRTTVRKATIQSAGFPPQAFDAILLMSYLEHEPYPSEALRCARDLLRPGGHLFIKVPHYGSWNRRLMGRSWSGYFFPQHLFYFTPRTITRMLDKCGFETVRNRFRDHVPLSDVLWIAARRSDRKLTPLAEPATTAETLRRATGASRLPSSARPRPA